MDMIGWCVDMSIVLAYMIGRRAVMIGSTSYMSGLYVDRSGATSYMSGLYVDRSGATSYMSGLYTDRSGHHTVMLAENTSSIGLPLSIQFKKVAPNIPEQLHQ
ncbi:MAG TPA: hypothetical protein K8V56_09145 [Sporosarcina psychrophila]|uniref:Uncharacterized protein n=1 Tax=Sporosarcina psychrophila TaxID=1476 RepID=A0A921FYC9_SPOPS|nr:hypothetical protein [Sporosarcina psychrophila]